VCVCVYARAHLYIYIYICGGTVSKFVINGIKTTTIDIIGVLYHLVAEAHAHIQKLVSLVKMATVLEERHTEEQRSVERSSGQKDSVQTIFIKTYLLFTVLSVCCVKRFTTWSRNFLKDFSKFADDVRPGGK
jgi:hypothetical protein